MKTYRTEEDAALAAAGFAVENDSFAVPRMMIFRDQNGEYRYEGIGNSIVVETLQKRIIDDSLELVGEVSAAAAGATFYRYEHGNFVSDRILYGIG